MKPDLSALHTSPVRTSERLGRTTDAALGSSFYRSPGTSRSTGGGQITIDPRLFLRLSLGCIACLAGLGLLVAYLADAREHDVPRLFLRALLLDQEQNVKTFFAFGLLVLCSILLLLAGARAHIARQPFRLHWLLLGALFFLAAFDEATMLHEKLSPPIRGAMDTSGWFYFAWIIPLGTFVAVLAVFYLPFLRSLPAPFGMLFALSGALFLGGAIGLEMPGAAHFEAHGDQTFTYHLITTAEETLEMLGLTLFAYFLMRYLGRREERIQLAFRAG